MTDEHARTFSRFFCNRSTVFDDLHDTSLSAAGWLLQDASDDLSSTTVVDAPDGPQANEAPVLIELAPDVRPLDHSLPAFNVGSDLLGVDAAADVLDAAAVAFDDNDLFLFGSGLYDHGPVGSGSPFSVNMPAHPLADGSLASSQGTAQVPAFEAAGGFDASISLSTSFAAPEAPAAGGADITMIGGDVFAKGDGGGASAGGGSGGVLKQYFSGSANGTAGYDIWIEFKGTSWTTALQDAFIKAADYFTTIISSDIGGGGLYRGKIVDDLYVTAEVKAIDGAGGILGQAGPSATWTATELTAAGQMQFDVADALNYLGLGLWDDIVTHEMMHVLGFGSLWNYGANPLVSNFQYTGSNALAAYNAQFGGNATYIPVENDGGSGTAGAHWDEQALTNELMTGYINNDGIPTTTTDNYLSKFSVMSLADLGYPVVYSDYPYDGVILL